MLDYIGYSDYAEARLIELSKGYIIHNVENKGSSDEIILDLREAPNIEEKDEVPSWIC